MKSPGPRILCTEDDADTREIINLILSNAGYKVTCVGGSEEALQLARSKLFALYLVDSWLPDLSGIELTRKIREFDPTTPILFFSGAAYDADQESAFQAGAQSYLVKPAGYDELVAEVSRLVAASRTAV